MRLALKEVAEALPVEARPHFWVGLWEHYVESQVDYRASAETLARKLAQAGSDAWQLLEWLGPPAPSSRASGPRVALLRRVFGEQFDVRAGAATPVSKERVLGSAAAEPTAREAVAAVVATTPVPPETQLASPGSSLSPSRPRAEADLPPAADTEPAAGPAQGSLESHPNLATGGLSQDQPTPDQPASRGTTVQLTLRPEANDVPPADADPVASPSLQPEPVLAGGAAPASVPAPPRGAAAPNRPAGDRPKDGPTQSPSTVSGPEVQPKDQQQLSSARVQNPHEAEATYAAKGQGDHWKEHVGYKIQVAETVCEATLARGEPTRNFIVGIVTHPAYESDEVGAAKMEAEQAAMGFAKPPVQYVDGAYVSARKLVEAAAAGRELIGPAPPPATNNQGRLTSDAFQVQVEQRRATCPAGHQNTQCSRLEEQATGKVLFRFEWDTATCAACPLRRQCIKAEHKHRTLVVGEHHTALQTRRQEQRTEPFKQRMKHRNAIEGTQSELVRGHDMRHARYRGLAKTQLQNYFTGAACNLKRWLRRLVWEMGSAATAGQDQSAGAN